MKQDVNVVKVCQCNTSLILQIGEICVMGSLYLPECNLLVTSASETLVLYLIEIKEIRLPAHPYHIGYFVKENRFSRQPDNHL